MLTHKLPTKSYIICSTPRSGSNLLNSYLRNLEVFGSSTEWLNPRHMANTYGKKLKFTEESYRKNPEQVFKKIVENNLCPEGSFSIKVHFSQYFDMVQQGFDPFKILINPSFVLIKRQDILAQAISLEKAEQQGSWTYLEKANKEAVYDFASIANKIKSISNSYQGWLDFFKGQNINFFEVVYEDLLENPQEVIRNVMEFYGKKLSEHQISNIHTHLQRQTDNINQEWRERFERDLALSRMNGAGSMPHKTRDRIDSVCGPKVLCYSPYNYYAIHGMWEMTILHALRLRGAEVRHVLCDGLYTDCDLHYDTVNPRPPLACNQCQANVTALSRNMSLPFEWLGRYLIPDDLREARRWADGLSPDRYPEATYEEWPIGKWVESSIHTHFSATHLDLDVPRVRDVYRSYLYSGLVAALGLSRLMDDYRPDLLFQFNGRMSSPRIAIELALQRGIRVISHERGERPETLKLIVNARSSALKPIREEIWRNWGNIPLTPDELEKISRYMSKRGRGGGFSWRAYSPPMQDLDHVRQRLNLRLDRPVWVLFTSSDHEAVANPDRKGPFERQIEWIKKTIVFAAAQPELDLVIRVHPNTAGKSASQGNNVQQLQELTRLMTDLPGNVRTVMPEDDVSSYSLMDLATVGLVYHSSVGLEMACRGKKMIVAAGSLVNGLPFVTTLKSKSDYDRVLEETYNYSPSHEKVETQRLAYRFAYGLYYRYYIPFPLVKMKDSIHAELAYSSLDALLPGRDPHLDRICRIILEQEAVCPAPTDEERRRSAEDEAAWFRGPSVTMDTHLVKEANEPPSSDLCYPPGPTKRLLPKTSSPEKDNEPDISVIIPTHNRAATLEQCLRALARQSLPPQAYEVLVCDDGSTDDTTARVERYEAPYDLRYLRRDGCGPAAARNMGLRHARGRYLLFLNDDSIAAPDLLERHLEAHRIHEDQRLAILGDFRFSQDRLRRQPMLQVLTTTTLIFAYVNMTAGETYDFMHFWTCNLSIPREAVERIGGFDEAYRYACVEDTEFGYRLEQVGYRVLYYPQAFAEHAHDMSSVERFCERQRRVAAEFLKFFRAHPETLSSPAWSYLQKTTRAQLRRNVEQHRGALPNNVETAQNLSDQDLQRMSASQAGMILEELTRHLLWLHEYYYGNLGRLEGLEAEGLEAFEQLLRDREEAVPKLSVIIPTHNRSSTLRRCLDALQGQSLSPEAFEVLVCDDGSTDDTAEMVQAYRASYPLRYVRQESRGPAAARNLGIRQAKGAYLLFINDDTIAGPELLKAHLQAHAHPDRDGAAVLGSFGFAPEHREHSPFLAFLEDNGLLFRKVRHGEAYHFRYFWTCNLSIAMEAVVRAGLFDEDFRHAAGEDVELGYRLFGWDNRVFYDENCVAVHDHAPAPRDFFVRRQRQAAAGAVLVARKHPELTKEMTGLEALDDQSRQMLGMRITDLEETAEESLHSLMEGERSVQAGNTDDRSRLFWPLFHVLNTFWCARGLLEGIEPQPSAPAPEDPMRVSGGNGRPKVSIIVPAFNYAHFVEHCLESIGKQTYTNYEVIVVDDHSTDGSEEVIERCSRSLPLEYIRNRVNLGQPRNCNKGARLASGDFLCFLHADDLFLPENLEKKVHVLEGHGAVGAVFSGLYLVDEQGRFGQELQHPGRPPQDYFGDRDDYHDLLLHNYIPTPSCVLMRRDCFEKAGGFNEKLLNGCDWELWIRLAAQTKWAFLHEPLIGYRLHGANLHTELRRQNDVVVKDHFWILDRIFFDGNGDEALQRIRVPSYEQIVRTIQEIPESYRQRYIDALRVRVDPSLLRGDASSDNGAFSVDPREAAACEAKNNYIGALKGYLGLLRRGEGDTVAVNQGLGRTWMKLLGYWEAGRYFENILDINTSYSDVYGHLGHVYRQQNRFEDAESVYRQGVAMIPQNAALRRGLIEVYLEQWRLDEAAAEIGIYLQMFPDDAETGRVLDEISQTKQLLRTRGRS